MATCSVIHPLDRSESAVVVSIRKYLPQQITQYELETLALLRNALKQREAQLRWLEDDVKTRLAFGAAIEQGAHTVLLKKHFRQSGRHTVSLHIE